MNKYIILISSFFIAITAKALTLSAPKTFPIIHNNQAHEVYEISPGLGKLEDGTWVKLVCIKKGMIGMPNVSMPSYRGTYVNKQGERCYVFVAEPEGTITYNNQILKVYHTQDNKGFLNNGTKIRIECLPVDAAAKILITPEYRGTYYLDDATGKRQQCNVYTLEKIYQPKPASAARHGGGTRPR